MESVIKWQTGVPKETGAYIVTVQGGKVFQSKYTYFYRDKCCYFVNDYGNPILERVLAWCPMSEIKPYKE